MINSMPTFAVLRNKVILGYVSAVSHDQAMTRAKAVAKEWGFKRFEIEACGNAKLDRKARESLAVDTSFNMGRSRYATPGFEDRRAALIAEYKAR